MNQRRVVGLVLMNTFIERKNVIINISKMYGLKNGCKIVHLLWFFEMCVC